VRGIDELWDGRRCSKVSDPVRPSVRLSSRRRLTAEALSLHDVLYGMLVLDKGDDPHLSFALAFDPSSGRGWAL